jgi:hypothetical protein
MDFPGRSSIASAYYSMCIYIKSTTVYLPKKKKKKNKGKRVGERENSSFLMAYFPPSSL